MYNQIMDDNAAIEETRNQIAELDKQIKQLSWDKFDYLREKLDDITAEAEYLQEILSSEKMMDDYGFYNNRGWANAAMITVQYKEAQKGMNEVLKERAKITDAMRKNNKDEEDRWQDLTDKARDYAKAMMAAKDAMKSFVEESIQANLSKLKELMENYKKAMSTAKDLYDFQKNISNQTNTIANLRKQLTAYENDDSEAARKRRQELRNQLNQAEQQLQETEWDRYISQTGDMLDNLYEDYEKLLNARLDNLDKLLEDEIKAINQNGGNVGKGLNEIATKYGVPIDRLNELMSGDNQNSITGKIGDIHDLLDDNIKWLQNAINNGAMKAVEKGSQDVNYDSKTGQVSVGKSSTDIHKDTTTNTIKQVAKKSTATNQNKTPSIGLQSRNVASETAINLISKIKTDINKMVNLSGNKSTRKTLSQRYNDIGKVESKILSEGFTADNMEDLRTQLNNLLDASQKIGDNAKTKAGKQLYADFSSRILKYIKSLKLPKYATGTKKVRKDHLGITQDDGSELLFRTDSGALLTPLGQGDMVFTNEMSQRLWEIAKTGVVPTVIETSKPNVGSYVGNTVTANNQIELVLPNVQDYQSFKRELQNDNNFEKFIQEVTIGKVSGNNSLNKRKY